MNSVSLNPRMGAQERKVTVWGLKIDFSRKKICYKVYLCEISSGKVVSHSLSYLTMLKWLMGTSPSTWNFLAR